MQNQTFDAFVFDMDGTLLDTLPDLVAVTNGVLEKHGYPTHDAQTIVRMVGNGYRSLISQAIPQDLDPAVAEAVIEEWKREYEEHGTELTVVYNGVMEMLQELKARGKKTAVLSNKYDLGVKLLSDQYFGELMDFALGDGPVPRKPNPTGLLLTAETLGVPLERVAYIGDTNTDITVAHNAGVFAIGCTWGYHSREQLKAENPHALIDQPADLLNYA